MHQIYQVLAKFMRLLGAFLYKNGHQYQLMPKFINASLLGIKAENCLSTRLRGKLKVAAENQ